MRNCVSDAWIERRTRGGAGMERKREDKGKCGSYQDIQQGRGEAD